MPSAAAQRSGGPENCGRGRGRARGRWIRRWSWRSRRRRHGGENGGGEESAGEHASSRRAGRPRVKPSDLFAHHRANSCVPPPAIGLLPIRDCPLPIQTMSSLPSHGRVVSARAYSGVDMTELSKAVDEWRASLPEDCQVRHGPLGARALPRGAPARRAGGRDAARAQGVESGHAAGRTHRGGEGGIRKGKYFERQGPRGPAALRRALRALRPQGARPRHVGEGVIHSLEHEAAVGDPAQKFVILYDRTLLDREEPRPRFPQGAGAVLSDNYPSIANAYIYPCGLVLNGIWNIVKRFLDPRTRAKFEMVTSNQALLDLFDRDQLPDTLGGTAVVSRAEPSASIYLLEVLQAPRTSAVSRRRASSARFRLTVKYSAPSPTTCSASRSSARATRTRRATAPSPRTCTARSSHSWRHARRSAPATPVHPPARLTAVAPGARPGSSPAGDGSRGGSGAHRPGRSGAGRGRGRRPRV